MISLLNLRRCVAGSVLVLLALAPAVRAQQAPAPLGVGVLLGDPSGITVKHYPREGLAYEGLAAWDFDQYLLLQAHVLFERPLPESPLRYFYGPGAYVQFNDDPTDGATLGLSGNFGVNFFTDRFEIFLQVTPRLNLVPDTRGAVGAGIGLRYYP